MPRPGLRHVQCLVQIGHFDLCVAPDDLGALQKGAVGDQRLAVRREVHAGGRMWRLELAGAANLGAMFGEPTTYLFILLRARLVGERFPRLPILRSPTEQKHIVHRCFSTSCPYDEQVWSSKDT